MDLESKLAVLDHRDGYMPQLHTGWPVRLAARDPAHQLLCLRLSVLCKQTLERCAALNAWGQRRNRRRVLPAPPIATNASADPSWPCDADDRAAPAPLGNRGSAPSERTYRDPPAAGSGDPANRSSARARLPLPCAADRGCVPSPSPKACRTTWILRRPATLARARRTGGIPAREACGSEARPSARVASQARLV